MLGLLLLAGAAEFPHTSLTLLDVPNNVTGVVPSMQQSLDGAAAIQRLSIYGVQSGFQSLFPENIGLQMGLGMPATGLATFFLVYVGAWQHEEWHRAVLSHRDISSRNGLYYPSAWSNGTISVDHVTDADLSRLKQEHPADTARLMSAGMEGAYVLVQRLGDDLFFYDAEGKTVGPFYTGQSWMIPPMLALVATNVLYQAQCASPESDTVTDAENQLRANELDRDFTGLDCTAWVYDMRRPDEPYEARGAHPYHDGVDRYRSWSDLTDAEHDYLKTQTWLQLINLLNPHLAGVDGFVAGDARWLLQAGYVPMAWGYRVDARFSLRTARYQGAVELQSGVARAGWFPGLDAHIQAQVGRLTPGGGVGLWLQPQDLRWDAAQRSPGGRVYAQVGVPLTPWLDVTPTVEAKTAGQVLGDVSLDPAVNGRLAMVFHTAAAPAHPKP